jgi:mRNA interferase RelE/StbE
MKLFLTRSFEKDYERLPLRIQKHLDSQILRLLENPRHASLRTKKIKGTALIWEGQVTRSYRFTFQIQGDTYILRRVGTHEILKSP